MKYGICINIQNDIWIYLYLEEILKTFLKYISQILNHVKLIIWVIQKTKVENTKFLQKQNSPDFTAAKNITYSFF